MALASVLWLLAAGAAGASAPAGDWPRFGFDPARNGVNPGESAISSSTVGRLRLAWTATLRARADSTPILLTGVSTPRGTLDVLYLTTLEGELVALDAATGNAVWTAATSGPSKLTNSSPVADPDRRHVYGYGLDGRLHRYRADTGAEDRGGAWPVLVTRMPATEKESSSLNAAGGRVYVTTSGYLGDRPPYQGHVVTIDTSSGDSRVFNSLCSDLKRLLGPKDCPAERSGIWARAGVVVDPVAPRIFAVTGNGPFGGGASGRNWGNSVLALSADGSRLLDSYTPADHARLDQADLDLGSTAPALLPAIRGSRVAHLLVQGGKDLELRLLDRDNLSGRGGPGNVGGELQTLPMRCMLFTQPAVWTDGDGRVWLFVAASCGITGYEVTVSREGAPLLREAWTDPAGGTSPVVAGGVLFAARSKELFALDPRTGRELWNSKRAGGSVGGIHWESPIVAGGRVFLADEERHVLAYGLPE